MAESKHYNTVNVVATHAIKVALDRMLFAIVAQTFLHSECGGISRKLLPL